MIMPRLFSLSFLCALLCAVIRCSSAKGPECFPVRGRVSYKGKPLAEATVVLHRIGGDMEGGHKPIAFTAADGTYVLTTMAKDDGASPGEYAITFELRAPQTIGEEIVRNGPHLLPVKYSRPDSSGQKFTVEPGANVIPAINLL
jgi:hypothetical protein